MKHWLFWRKFRRFSVTPSIEHFTQDLTFYWIRGILTNISYIFLHWNYIYVLLVFFWRFDFNWSLVSIQNKWFSTTILPHYALRVSSPPPYINEELFCSKLQCPSEFQRLRISSACWAPLILASFPSLTVEIKWEWRVFEHKKAAFSSPMPWSWFR